MAFAAAALYLHLAGALSWSYVLHKSTEPLHILTNHTVTQQHAHNNLSITTARLAHVDKVENASVVIDNVLNQVVHSSMSTMMSKLSESLKEVLQKLGHHQHADDVHSSTAKPSTEMSLARLASLLNLFEAELATTPHGRALNNTQDMSQRRPSAHKAPAALKRPAKVMEVPLEVVMDNRQKVASRRGPTVLASQFSSPFLETSRKPPAKSVVVEFITTTAQSTVDPFQPNNDQPYVEEEEEEKPRYPSITLVTVTPRQKFNDISLEKPSQEQPVRESAKFLIETLFIAIGGVFGTFVILSITLVAMAYRKSRRQQKVDWSSVVNKCSTIPTPSQGATFAHHAKQCSPSTNSTAVLDSTDRELETFIAYAHSMPRLCVNNEPTNQEEQWWKMYP